MTERLTKLRIQNYRCLRDVTIDFEPLTALVGPNASGKSSILYAMDPTRPIVGSDWNNASIGGVDGTAYFGATCRRATAVNGQTLGSMLALIGFQLLRLDVQHLRRSAELAPATILQTTGSGMPNLLHTLTRSQQSEVADRLKSLVPLYNDVDTRSHQPGTHEVVFQDRWSLDRWLRPHEVSDGTMLLLALLLIPYQTPEVTIVGIEEPEHGIHPYLIENIVKMLRMLANGELGPRAVQVILTTHSPTLLGFLRPEEVRFLRRDRQTGGTIVEKAPVDSPNWDAAFASYERDLGAMWLSGALGGVTGAS